MEPIIPTHIKRSVVAFAPYRRRASGELEVFLQLRDEKAPVHPNIYSLFGGGIERGEDETAALLREVEEELIYSPRSSQLFSRFETARAVFSVFVEEVGTDFESRVSVREGKGGAFLSFTEAVRSGNVSPIALAVVEGMASHFR